MKRFSTIFLSTLILSCTTVVSNASMTDGMKGLEKYVSPANAPASAPKFTYTPDGTACLMMSNDKKSVTKHDIKTGREIETVFSVDRARETTLTSIEGFTMSPDGSKLLVYTSREDIYRRSFKARYYVYEIRTRLLRPLSETQKMQQSPVFSPDGRMVAFMGEDNNIYVKKIDYDTEVPVTKDGKKNEVINGVPDWTYEEEFQTTCSMAWSPDNLTLCYLKYNEKEVPMYSFPLYEGTCSPRDEYALYPGAFSYKYPVAGENNSKVTLHSYNVETRKVKNISLPDSRIEYIPRIEYAYSPDRLVVTTLNRAQNRMEVYSVNPGSTVVKSLLVEESKAWIDPITYENMTFMPDCFVVISGRSGYNHAYRYTYAGAMSRQLTKGEYDVTAYYGHDTARGLDFFQSTITGPLNRVICSVDAKGVVKHLSADKGTSSATFSPDMTWYMMNYSNTSTPPTYTLVSTRDNKTVRTLEDNKSYASRYASSPRKEFFTMNGEGGLTFNGYMVKPIDFDPSRRYPVIMYQYSGPGSQEVRDRWGADWSCYFAEQGYIVMCVDGRGTGGRGNAFRDIVYKRLGHYETIDQIAAARYAASLPYVDGDRIGIYGWSYGGYEAIMAASAKDAPYRAAVAVAPVTDWRYYDSVYAERYMLTPRENEPGYDEASAINRVKDLKCRLLIMHGTADDNVHLSNTIQYVSALESAGGFCDMLLFPNMNHSINGCNARFMVMARMLDYFNRNLKN